MSGSSVTQEIIFHSLEEVTLAEIQYCFNKSFEKYFVPLQLTTEQLQNKILTEGIDLSLSYGAFEDNKLVGFILHAIDRNNDNHVAWNGGTGVMPEYRGKNISFLLYEFALMNLKKHGINKTILEVIDKNESAIKVYIRSGFEITRTLNSYTGRPDNISPSFEPEIKEEEVFDWPWINSHAAWEPAWQYNENTISRSAGQFKILRAYEQDQPVTYLIYNPSNGRIAQFGPCTLMLHREYLSALFNHLAKICEHKFSIIHLDSKATDAIEFLKTIGLEELIVAYEMERGI